MYTSIRTSIQAAILSLSLFMLPGCQNTLAPGQTQAPETQQRRFTQISMNDFINVTSPPQGLTAGPGELTATANLTSPPQGVTAPPMGMSTALERSHYKRFDLDADGQWNRTELSAYISEWRSLNQTDRGFRTKIFNLDLNIDALIDTYDRNYDRLLDYEEALTLEMGLAQALSQTSG